MYSFANDFAFIDAYNSFEMMKEIILVFKNRTDKFEFRFSTVTEYYEAVKKERQVKVLPLTLYHDDLFPMEQIYKDSFWTGYYTSRPNLKKEVREFS